MTKVTRHLAAPLFCAALIPASMVVVAQGTPVPGTKPAPKSVAAKPAALPPGVLATVNGEPIRQDEVVHTLFADQLAQLAVTDPMFAAARFRRDTAGSVGALVLQRMANNGWKPVTVSRADIVQYILKDKPPIVAQTVDRLVQERVVEQAAKKAGIALTPQEVKERTSEALEMAKKTYHRENASDSAILKAVGFRAEALRHGVVTQLLLQKLIEKDIDSKLGHPATAADWLDASHILVRVNVTDPAQKEKAFADGLAKIKGYRDEIESGKISFDDAAEKYSDDGGTKFQKGSLGLFLRGTMVPEFDKAAFDLPVGKVSEPVRTVYGWHLIRVNRAGKDTTGPERAQALKALLQQRLQPKMMQLIQEAKVNNPLAPPTSPTMMGSAGR